MKFSLSPGKSNNTDTMFLCDIMYSKTLRILTQRDQQIYLLISLVFYSLLSYRNIHLYIGGQHYYQETEHAPAFKSMALEIGS